MVDYTSEVAKRLSPTKNIPNYSNKLVYSSTNDGLMPVLQPTDLIPGDWSAYKPAPQQNGIRIGQQFTEYGVLQALPDNPTSSNLMSVLNYMGGTTFLDSGATPWFWYGQGDGKGTKFADDKGWILNPTNARVYDYIMGPKGIGAVEVGPGQSYNPFTAQFDNAKLHPDDAEKMNRGAAYRRVTESGLSRADMNSARDTSSVLASLTEQVVGSRLAAAQDNGLQTTQRITDIGLGEGGTKSILGTEKAATKSKLKNVLSSSSSF